MSAAQAVPLAEPGADRAKAGREWIVVATLMAMIGWGGNEFTPLLAVYREHGYSAVGVDALLAAYVAGLVPGLLIASALSDMRGRRPVMLVGGAAAVLGSLLIALAPFGAAPVAAGRLLSGLGIGIAMAVGTTWVKELSAGASPGAGARRAATATTIGLAVGPGVAGALAQWAPWPRVLPYLVHVAVTLPFLAWVAARAVETRTHDDGPRSLRARLRVPAAGHRRFVRVVLPLAPWVFGTVAVAYVILPQLAEARSGGNGLLLATALTVLTLAAGVLIQPVARRLDDVSTARACVVSMLFVVTGLILAAAVAVSGQVWPTLIVAPLLGCAYGIAVVSGLLEVQRIAAPDELAGLTGVYYSLTYTGFLLPLALAALARWFSYPTMLLALALLALACALPMATTLPSPPPPP
ncbi:MFS transporter [Actinocorallia aurea]